MLLGLYARSAGDSSIPGGAARRVSFSELLGSRIRGSEACMAKRRLGVLSDQEDCWASA